MVSGKQLKADTGRAGWRSDPVPRLGARFRVGGEHFQIGRRSQVRHISLDGSRCALLVVNQLGDMWVHPDVLSGNSAGASVMIQRKLPPAAPEPLGWSGTGLPDYFRYAAAFPRAGRKDDGEWDLVTINHRMGDLEVALRTAPGSGGGGVSIGPIRTLFKFEGYPWRLKTPAAVDWRRDGMHDLLIGAEDGTVQRHARVTGDTNINFEPKAELVHAGDMPIRMPGPLYIDVVDFFGRGRSDLLIGSGDGYIHLFEDIGDESQVKYARGRRLVDGEGFIKLTGSACPTMHNGHLVAADIEGSVWAWPIEAATSWIVEDWPAALGLEALPAGWTFEDATRTLIAGHGAAPLDLRPPGEGVYEVHLQFTQAPGRGPGMPDRPRAMWRASNQAQRQAASTGEFHDEERQCVFAGVADLRGATLIIEQALYHDPNYATHPMRLQSVRLTPVSTDPSTVGTRKKPPMPVSAIIDAIMWFNHWKADTPGLMDELMGLHEQAGFTRVYYKLGGACWEYPSKVPGAEPAINCRPEQMDDDRRSRLEKARKLLLSINRVEHAVAGCHRRNMECFGWIRLQNHGEHTSSRGNKALVDRFYVEHQDCLEKDIHGNVFDERVCLAYPQVRQFVMQIVEEAMGMGCDGILIDTLRQLPKVMWGDPVVEMFRQRHGLDMRTLPPFDARVVALQDDIFTDFLRETRKHMLAVNAKGRLHVRVCTPHVLMGCNPRRWAAEGIVDEIIIEHRSFQPTDPDIAGLVRACEGTACKALAGFARESWGGEKMPLHPYLIDRKVEQYLAGGAAGISFYESAHLIDRPALSRAIRRINNPSSPGSLPSRAMIPS